MADIKTNNNRTRLIAWLLFFAIVVIGLISLFYFLNSKNVLPNVALLEPLIHQNAKKNLDGFSEKEIEEVLASFKNPTLIPKGLEVPEFAPEQARFSRAYLDSCVSKANKVLASDAKIDKLFFLDANVSLWNGAYAKSKDSKYLEYALNQLLGQETLSNSQLIGATDILKTQRLMVSQTKSDLYTKVIAKIKKQISEQLNTKNPSQAVELLLLAYSLPLTEFKTEVQNALKPVLVKAFQNINVENKEGLFLSPEASSEFSSKLIKLAWYAFIDKKEIPDWLYNLAEKEACRLAYQLEQDGCLPVWEKGKWRISMASEIYKASLIFDRDDFRYLAYCGRRMANAYPPEQKDFEFKEIGILIYRSHWNHVVGVIDRYYFDTTGLPEPESIQITYNKNNNEIAVSLGAITQFVFQTNLKIESAKELSSLLKFSYTVDKPNDGYDYKLIVNDIKLKLLFVSPFYLLKENGDIEFTRDFIISGKYKEYKNPHEIKMLKDSENNIKEIEFNCWRKKW